MSNGFSDLAACWFRAIFRAVFAVLALVLVLSSEKAQKRLLRRLVTTCRKRLLNLRILGGRLREV